MGLMNRKVILGGKIRNYHMVGEEYLLSFTCCYSRPCTEAPALQEILCATIISLRKDNKKVSGVGSLLRKQVAAPKSNSWVFMAWQQEREADSLVTHRVGIKFRFVSAGH